MACLALTMPSVDAAVVGGRLDLGNDDGWVETGTTNVPANNTVIGNGVSYAHAATGSSMTITAVTRVTAGNTWRSPQVDFSTTQVRSDWQVNNLSGTGGDLHYVRVDVMFGSGIGESMVGAGDGGVLPFDALDNINWSSQNGSSELYEWGILQLRSPQLAGNLDESALSTYAATQYGTTTIGAHAGEGAGVYSADDFNTTITPGDPDPAAGSADTTDPLVASLFSGVDPNFAITGFTWYTGIMDVTDTNALGSMFSESNSSPSAGLNGIEWNASSITAVPEPSAFAAIGLLAAVGLTRHRRRAASPSKSTST